MSLITYLCAKPQKNHWGNPDVLATLQYYVKQTTKKRLGSDETLAQINEHILFSVCSQQYITNI